MQWRKGRVKGEHPSVQWARSTEQLGWGHIDMLMELKASGHPPDTGTCRDLGCDPLNLSSSLRSRFPCSSHSDWGVLAPLSFGYDWFLFRNHQRNSFFTVCIQELWSWPGWIHFPGRIWKDCCKFSIFLLCDGQRQVRVCVWEYVAVNLLVRTLYGCVTRRICKLRCVADVVT